jgi:hypothetical protein
MPRPVHPVRGVSRRYKTQSCDKSAACQTSGCRDQHENERQEQCLCGVVRLWENALLVDRFWRQGATVPWCNPYLRAAHPSLLFLPFSLVRCRGGCRVCGSLFLAPQTTDHLMALLVSNETMASRASVS